MTVYAKFGSILEYPVSPIGEIIADCAALLAAEAPDAQPHLLAFESAIAGKRLGELQEIYASTFDLRPDCTTNLGYHLFGDDARRGVFLAELKGRMEARGMTLGVELPDHLSFILQYLDLAEEERPTMTEDCLIPAISRMIEVLNDSGNPYEHALRALLFLLRHQQEAFVTSEAVDA